LFKYREFYLQNSKFLPRSFSEYIDVVMPTPPENRLAYICLSAKPSPKFKHPMESLPKKYQDRLVRLRKTEEQDYWFYSKKYRTEVMLPGSLFGPHPPRKLYFRAWEQYRVSYDEQVDEAYWAKRSEETLDIAKRLLEITQDIYGDVYLHFYRDSIALTVDEYSQILVYEPFIDEKYPCVWINLGNKRDEIEAIVKEMEIPYDGGDTRLTFEMSVKTVSKFRDDFREIAALNKQWWLEIQ